MGRLYRNNNGTVKKTMETIISILGYLCVAAAMAAKGLEESIGVPAHSHENSLEDTVPQHRRAQGLRLKG